MFNFGLHLRTFPLEKQDFPAHCNRYNNDITCILILIHNYMEITSCICKTFRKNLVKLENIIFIYNLSKFIFLVYFIL